MISRPREATPGEQLDIDVRDAYGHATAFDLRVEGPAVAAGNAVVVRADAAPGAGPHPRVPRRPIDARLAARRPRGASAAAAAWLAGSARAAAADGSTTAAAGSAARGAPPRAPPVALSPSTPRRPVGSRAARAPSGATPTCGRHSSPPTRHSAVSSAPTPRASPTRGVQILTFEDVLALCGDFDIAPSLVDADAILSLYRVVEKQKKARGLAYAQFSRPRARRARGLAGQTCDGRGCCVNALYRWGLADPVRLEGPGG